MATQDFESWISSLDTCVGAAWPEAAKREIAQVLRLNKEGTTNITMPQMVERLQRAHGLDVTRRTLGLYVEKQFGRTWSGRRQPKPYTRTPKAAWNPGLVQQKICDVLTDLEGYGLTLRRLSAETKIPEKALEENLKSLLKDKIVLVSDDNRYSI